MNKPNREKVNENSNMNNEKGNNTNVIQKKSNNEKVTKAIPGWYNQNTKNVENYFSLLFESKESKKQSNKQSPLKKLLKLNERRKNLQSII